MESMELKAPKGAGRKRKVLGRGRGTGHGTRAGRGNKGQNSRSGGGVRPGFEGGQMPLYRRIARRGFNNKRFQTTVVVVNIRDIDGRFESGETVSRQSLCDRGLIKRTDEVVKVLGDGELTKKLTVDVDRVSASARAKIEKAGGTVVADDVKPDAASAEVDTKKKAKGEKSAKAEKPKAEKPKAEKPKAEKPKAEKPKAELEAESEGASDSASDKGRTDEAQSDGEKSTKE